MTYPTNCPACGATVEADSESDRRGTTITFCYECRSECYYSASGLEIYMIEEDDEDDEEDL
jgi:hypothetical protein